MRILVVDDKESLRKALVTTLKGAHEVLDCGDGETALTLLEQKSIDLVLCDVRMPGISGHEVLRQGKEKSPQTVFLLMTAYSAVDEAINAIRLGCEDYLIKPIDMTDLKHRIERIEKLRNLAVENTLKLESLCGAERMIGRSLAIAKMREFVTTVAQVTSPVLILGESGTGKEVMARAIHEVGPRKDNPFIAINCASLTEQLMESELFGHEKGAFTGAQTSKPGKFELATNGTIFLDEVGELSPSLQAKLLRVLQEKEFYRLGGVRQIKSEARVVAATNRRLREMVKQGSFREDLFFRLNVLSCELPPLRERREDLPMLIDYFWAKLRRDLGRSSALSATTKEILGRYDFPGNIRELQNILERLMVLGSTSPEIEASRLPTEVLRSEAAPAEVTATSLLDSLAQEGLEKLLDTREKELLELAMKETNHNQPAAAKLLKLNRGALQYKLRKHGLVNTDKEDKAA